MSYCNAYRTIRDYLISGSFYFDRGDLFPEAPEDSEENIWQPERVRKNIFVDHCQSVMSRSRSLVWQHWLKFCQ